jgi:hypothetical protein
MLSVYMPSKERNRTAVASTDGSARSSNADSGTPAQCTSSTRHPVTQWKSLTSAVCGIACSSGRVYVAGRATRPDTVSRYVAAVFVGTDPVTE